MVGGVTPIAVLLLAGASFEASRMNDKPSKQLAITTALLCTVIARCARVAELHRCVAPKQSVGGRELC